ncbi:MAG: type II toxin-antitoxin system RelE/ParE family toxin [Coriobacteriales bacterium]|jgi:phage-related protein|nr:type II toxin-antitoxin system RelE/ParE family toxin [Coriobacteriales bacterium]
MPLIRKMENELWEIRSRFRKGSARVFFIVDGTTMVLLHGIIKKTQKTPQKELDIARARLKSYQAEKETDNV